jgi:hypothetical protein
MDLGDYPLELDPAAMERLTTAIREFAPTVILTHAKEERSHGSDGAQGYLREYYSQRASQRANHAPHLRQQGDQVRRSLPADHPNGSQRILNR